MTYALASCITARCKEVLPILAEVEVEAERAAVAIGSYTQCSKSLQLTWAQCLAGVAVSSPPWTRTDHINPSF